MSAQRAPTVDVIPDTMARVATGDAVVHASPPPADDTIPRSNSGAGTPHSVSFADGVAGEDDARHAATAEGTAARRASLYGAARRSFENTRHSLADALSHIPLPHLPRRSTDRARGSFEARRSQSGGLADEVPRELLAYEGDWVLERAESDSEDGLLKIQGCSMIQRMTAKKLTFYMKHTLSKKDGHPVLVAHVTASIPFVNFTYENHLDGAEREGDMPSLGRVRYSRHLTGGEIRSLDVSLDPKNAWKVEARWHVDERGRFVKESAAEKGGERWKGRSVYVRR